MCFRRDLNDFSTKQWVFSENKIYEPVLFKGFPEPWRRQTLYSRIYLFPVQFCELFAEKAKIQNIRRKEYNYIVELIESISKDGLFNPCIMKYDNNGKLRYHDGYHRLTAILDIEGFNYIPIILESSPKIKGYGRLVNEEMFSMLNFIDKDFDV